LRRSGGH